MSYIFVNILLITLTTTILRLLKNKSYKILNIFIIAKSLIVVGALFIFDLYVLITNLFFISNVADLFEPLGVFVFGIICIILITSFSEAIPIWIYGGISGEMSKYEQAKQAKLRNLA